MPIQNPTLGLLESTAARHDSTGRRHELRASTGSQSRADQTTVRRANLGVVLKQIAAGEPRSRASVAAETGLTRGTVSSLVGELIELDLLRETGEDEHAGRVGRPAQTLELGDRIVSIGLEVNVDYLAVCVEDLTGTIRYERRVHTDNRRSSPRPVLNRLARMATRRSRPSSEHAADPGRRRGCAARASSRRRPARCCGRRTSAGRRSSSPTRSPRGCRASRSGRARRQRVEPRRARRALAGRRARRSRTSSASSARSASAAASSSTASSSAARTASAASSATSPSIPTGPPCKCGSAGCLETFVGLEAIARRAGIAVGAGGRTRSITAELVRRAEDGRRGRDRRASPRRAGTSASGSARP